MEWSQVALPAQILTAAAAKEWLKVSYSADDSVIDDCCKMAQEYIESETGRWLGAQTWDLFLDTFPAGDTIKIPKGPIKTVSSVKYLDSEGVEQTLSSSLYTVAKGLDTRIVLKKYNQWPTIDTVPQAVRIRVVGGWIKGADLSAGETELPRELYKTLKILVAHYYEHRGLIYTGLQMREMPVHLGAQNACIHHGVQNL